MTMHPHHDGSGLVADLIVCLDQLRRFVVKRGLLGCGNNWSEVVRTFADERSFLDFSARRVHVRETFDVTAASDTWFVAMARASTASRTLAPSAPGTDSYEQNRNLVLSEGTRAESVPNLEIETNDVKCSHASTVGPIDEEQRFYLESRGVPPEVAERLVVLGFFREVLDRLPASDLVADLAQRVAAKLDAGERS